VKLPLHEPKLGNIWRMLKKHGDTQDPPPERSQRTCQSLHNFPRPSSTKTNGIYTPPSPGTTNSSIHLKKKVNLLVLCQPLDKAVYCKLQVSMTWTLEHSDKEVPATSELAFSVEKTRTRKVNQPENQCTHYTHHSTPGRMDTSYFAHTASGIHALKLARKTSQRKRSPIVLFYTHQPEEWSTLHEPDFTINTPLIPQMDGPFKSPHLASGINSTKLPRKPSRKKWSPSHGRYTND
jgi:hypothetical protein